MLVQYDNNFVEYHSKSRVPRTCHERRFDAAKMGCSNVQNTSFPDNFGPKKNGCPTTLSGNSGQSGLWSCSCLCTHLLCKRCLQYHEQRLLRTAETNTDVTWCSWQNLRVVKARKCSRPRDRVLRRSVYGEILWGYIEDTHKEEVVLDGPHINTDCLPCVVNSQVHIIKTLINTLKPRQDGWNFADNVFALFFLGVKLLFFIQT